MLETLGRPCSGVQPQNKHGAHACKRLYIVSPPTLSPAGPHKFSPVLVNAGIVWCLHKDSLLGVGGGRRRFCHCCAPSAGSDCCVHISGSLHCTTAALWWKLKNSFVDSIVQSLNISNRRRSYVVTPSHPFQKQRHDLSKFLTIPHDYNLNIFVHWWTACFIFNT